jgi:hypothetical protein
MVSAGVIGRRPSWTRKSQALDLTAIRLGARRILAETLRQRSNREVTNKQFGACPYALFPARLELADVGRSPV